jgi:hypothetical protein
MITHCKKCDINWAQLWSQDNEEETTEYCPLCNTDLYLSAATDIVAYIRCPFTGAITNSETGEPHPAGNPTRPIIRTRKIKVWDETAEEFQDKIREAEDAGIAAGTFKEVDFPKRKFHFEEVNIF